MEVTAWPMVEVLVMVEAMAVAAVFGDGSGPAWDGAGATEEALDGGPFIQPGEEATPQPTGHIP